MVDRNGNERDIFDLDPATFGRCHQPIAAVVVAAQHGGEQFDERHPVDRRPEVMPGAVVGNPHVEAAQLDRDAAAVRH